MSGLDLNQIKIWIGKTEKTTVFDNYVEHVANQGLLPYKAILQYGGKQGESLYTHVTNMVMVLETLRVAIKLSDVEAQVLYTAFTVHDINKVVAKSPKDSFSKIATSATIASEIERLNLAAFFPAWSDYLEDITTIIREHPGHSAVGGEALFVKHAPVYRLGLARIKALVKLIRAVDIIDLSHGLTEQRQKGAFLSNLNTYLTDSGYNWQYEFVTHQLTEQRGLLANLIHNGITTYLHDQYHLMPLLYYPDGVAYLKKRQDTFSLNASDITKMAQNIAQSITDLTSANFTEFINGSPSGIKVDGKCLELGISFKKIWEAIYNIVSRRNFDPVELDKKIREKTLREFDKAQKKYPLVAHQVQESLNNPQLLVSSSPALVRLVELVRSYYIFLNKHFSKVVPDAWARIYSLLDLPPERYDYYNFFDALYARAYILSTDLALNEEDVYQRLEKDGQELMTGDQNDDPKTALFTQYLNLYAVFSWSGQPTLQVENNLTQYVTHQHKQCVSCSSPFATDKWMTADVRSDIKVQSFSNRLRGGAGEPKKYICAMCQLQFMLEKLNYVEIRGEKTLYLHLFPYSFMTAPFIQALQNSIRRIVTADTDLKALNINLDQNMKEYLDKKFVTPTFRSRTKKDKPQPYGLYLPLYSETVSNLLIFPINPSGDNDSEQFLFALWNAMLLQRHFGVKVLLSSAAVAPLSGADIPDLYVDNIPLACQGLLRRNDYAEYDNKDKPGALQDLWDDVTHLFALRHLTNVVEDKTVYLVRALLGHPLNIFYQTEKLLEARIRGQEQGGLLTWLFQQAISHVEKLAKNRGGSFMAQLSEELRQLATLAWQQKLKGSSLKKSSLLFPVAEVFQKLHQPDDFVDRETLKAATAQDIFDHLDRITEEKYKLGAVKKEILRQAIKEFVNGWFVNILEGVYQGNHRKMLSDEKLIRSAYHFYVREQIPRKEVGKDVDVEEIELETITEDEKE